jgi:hypothetical protein
MVTLEETLRQSRDWAINRIEILTENQCEEDAFSIVQEFSEWLDPEKDDHDIFSMEYINGQLEDMDD